MSGFGQAPFGSYPYGQAGSLSLINNWLPRIDLQIERLATIEFDLTNPSWVLTDVTIHALMPDGTYETVWTDSAKFTQLYRRGSARITILNGYHYVLRRTRGWPSSGVRVDVSAADLAGSVVSGQSS